MHQSRARHADLCSRILNIYCHTENTALIMESYVDVLIPGIKVSPGMIPGDVLPVIYAAIKDVAQQDL